MEGPVVKDGGGGGREEKKTAMEGRGGDKTEPESEETGKDKIDRQV